MLVFYNNLLNPISFLSLTYLQHVSCLIQLFCSYEITENLVHVKFILEIILSFLYSFPKKEKKKYLEKYLNKCSCFMRTVNLRLSDVYNWSKNCYKVTCTTHFYVCKFLRVDDTLSFSILWTPKYSHIIDTCTNSLKNSP